MTVWRYRIDVEYDGRGFSGWQTQRSQRTVQGELRRLLGFLGAETLPTGAGRTDAGVHAITNVTHVDLTRKWSADDLRRALITLMPKDLRILSVGEVKENFHARYSATARTYGYAVSNSVSAIFSPRRWHVKTLPTEDWMTAAAACLLGEIDATSLAKVKRETRSSRCLVAKVGWTPFEEGAIFRITADRFLWGMVRTIVGTLVRGYQAGEKPGFLTDILTRRDRSAAGESAPPQGLYLAAVQYPGEPDPAPLGMAQVARASGLIPLGLSAASVSFPDGA